MPTYGVTPTGFVRKPLQQIRQDILQYWIDNVSVGIDTTEEGLEAQFAGAVAAEVDEVWAAQQAEYASRDASQAEGQALDDLLRLKGVYRLAATSSLVGMTVTLASGTYPAGSLVVTVAGDTTARFANDATIVTAGGTLTGQVFRAETPGPVRANAGSLTNIVPTVGFTAATNPTDAVLGQARELDADFWYRAELETATTGSATADAVRSEILASDAAIRFCRVYVNDEPTTDANGVLGNAVEALVVGGADQTIRDAILRSKAGGIRAVGTTSGTATDSQGNVYSVGFSRPTVVTPYVLVTATANEDLYPGDAMVKQLLVDWADANLTVGMDVVRAQLTRLVMELPGVYDVEVRLASTYGALPSPGALSNFFVGVRGQADFDSGPALPADPYITVNHVAATGPA